MKTSEEEAEAATAAGSAAGVLLFDFLPISSRDCRPICDPQRKHHKLLFKSNLQISHFLGRNLQIRMRRPGKCLEIILDAIHFGVSSKFVIDTNSPILDSCSRTFAAMRPCASPCSASISVQPCTLHQLPLHNLRTIAAPLLIPLQTESLAPSTSCHDLSRVDAGTWRPHPLLST